MLYAIIHPTCYLLVVKLIPQPVLVPICTKASHPLKMSTIDPYTHLLQESLQAYFFKVGTGLGALFIIINSF
jgi:hypothetical protein